MGLSGLVSRAQVKESAWKIEKQQIRMRSGSNMGKSGQERFKKRVVRVVECH